MLTSSYYTLEWGKKAIWCDCQQLHFIRRPLVVGCTFVERWNNILEQRYCFFKCLQVLGNISVMPILSFFLIILLQEKHSYFNLSAIIAHLYTKNYRKIHFIQCSNFLILQTISLEYISSQRNLLMYCTSANVILSWIKKTLDYSNFQWYTYMASRYIIWMRKLGF